MSSLDALRQKWFLNFKTPGSSFPPVARHTGTQVKDYTDGNRVTELIDGQNYMKVWFKSIFEMIGKPKCEVYHAAWRLENVRTMGQSLPGSDALNMLIAARGGGVKVYTLMCRNMMTLVINNQSLSLLQSGGVSNAVLDNRFPPRGSNHQKFVCLKNPADPKVILGSIDISKTRWDRDAHAHTDGERDPKFGKPTHDVGVMVEGPAVADLEQSFIERWNDPTRSFGTLPLLKKLPKITTPVSNPGPVGGHSVQVLHTYGRTKKAYGYSWSPVGEFTVWAAYLNAIKKAEKLIYIEDQYFLPFDYLPFILRKPGHAPKKALQSDIVYQLGERIKAGVNVAVVVPSNAEDSSHVYQKYQRDLGVNYLKTVAGNSSGNFVITSLHNGTSWIYVHAKLMICDDEFVLIGSTNIGQRSMTLDSELHIGVVDKDNKFACDLRTKLWAEHLQRPQAQLKDPVNAFKILNDDTVASRGRVRPYDSKLGSYPYDHAAIMRGVVDPYAGPPRDKGKDS